MRIVSTTSACGSAGTWPSQQLVETNSGVPHETPEAVTVLSRRQISCPVISRLCGGPASQLHSSV